MFFHTNLGTRFDSRIVNMNYYLRFTPQKKRAFLSFWTKVWSPVYFQAGRLSGKLKYVSHKSKINLSQSQHKWKTPKDTWCANIYLDSYQLFSLVPALTKSQFLFSTVFSYVCSFIQMARDSLSDLNILICLGSVDCYIDIPTSQPNWNSKKLFSWSNTFDKQTS